MKGVLNNVAIRDAEMTEYPSGRGCSALGLNVQTKAGLCRRRGSQRAPRESWADFKVQRERYETGGASASRGYNTQIRLAWRDFGRQFIRVLGVVGGGEGGQLIAGGGQWRRLEHTVG